MRVLVTGALGQLGTDVCARLKHLGQDCIPADKACFDITDTLQTADFFAGSRPDAVVHCAAYTNVESAQKNPELCAAVNRDGTRNIAAQCRKLGAKLIYISSDYVFGDTRDGLLEPSFETNPLNVYGETKLMGEHAAVEECEKSFIVRTSWVFGRGGANFVKTMLRLGAQRESITVVNDQTGSPTYTADLAVLLCDMLETEKYGVYHATNEGFCTWAEFAEEIMQLAGLPAKIVPVSSEEYSSGVRRPYNSRLSKQCLTDAGFNRLPDRRDALGRFLTEIGAEKRD